MATKEDDKRVTLIEKKVSPSVQEAQSIKIVDEKSLEAATELLSKVNKNLDHITEEKEKITKPLNEALKVERNRWKPMETVLESAKTILRQGIIKYQTQAKKKADDDAAKIAERAGKGTILPQTALRKMGEIQAPVKSVSTTSGSLKFRTDKKFEVMDLSLLPLDYHLADEVAIRKAMKEGIELPGVRYYEEQVPINSR